MAKSTIAKMSSTAQSPTSVSLTTSAINLTKRQHSKIQRNTKIPHPGTADRRKRVAANARERKRMHLLNSAYDKLRKRLADAENKSKYDVLVQAKEYIQALAKICETHDKTQVPSKHGGEECQDSSGSASRVLPAVSVDINQRLPDSFEPNAFSYNRNTTINDQKIKLESPRSIAESHCTSEIDIDCCSPSTLSSPCLSLPDSVRSPTISKSIIFPHQGSHNVQQQVPENMTSCSTILNSPPLATTRYLYSDSGSTMTALRPDYLPRICQVKHQQMSHLNLTSADIYNQYAQAFQYIQRAT